MMEVVAGNAQHIGTRGSQQDAFGFSNLADLSFRAHGGVLMVLCDGMGGLAKGEAAASAAVQAVLAAYARKRPEEPVPHALERAIVEAQGAVLAVAGEGPAVGSTIVAAAIVNDRLYWVSLGDSRLYLCRGDNPAAQLTRDHTVAAFLAVQVERGEISAADAADAPDREALTGYLGSPEQPRPGIERAGLPLRTCDRIIACSDGVYRVLSPQALAGIGCGQHPMAAAEQIRDAVLALALPHQDNLTIAILDVRPSQEARRRAPSWRRPDRIAALSGLIMLAAGGAGLAWYVSPSHHARAAHHTKPAHRTALPAVPPPPAPSMHRPMPSSTRGASPGNSTLCTPQPSNDAKAPKACPAGNATAQPAAGHHRPTVPARMALPPPPPPAPAPPPSHKS
jgi:serine/threonine protein phosphatase PrpC